MALSITGCPYQDGSETEMQQSYIQCTMYGQCICTLYVWTIHCTLYKQNKSVKYFAQKTQKDVNSFDLEMAPTEGDCNFL